ncbi:MAG: hypothetical protein Q8Q39_00715 [bacterium]|nr:hypothetical protein [bacterium]
MRISLLAGFILCVSALSAQGGNTFAEKFPHVTLFDSADVLTNAPKASSDTGIKDAERATPKTNWKGIFWQSTAFLSLQTGTRLIEQEKTRRELRGPFFGDWLRSIRITQWNDGGKFFTNYIAHSAGGSVWAYIYEQNSAEHVPFRWNAAYRDAKLRQLGFAFVGSELFEFFSPLSEAAIGNVGYKTGKPGLVDHVCTPICGIAWSIGEDALDRYVVRKMLAKPGAHRKIAASLLNPTRSLANILRGKAPWYRR